MVTFCGNSAEVWWALKDLTSAPCYFLYTKKKKRCVSMLKALLNNAKRGVVSEDMNRKPERC